MLTQFVTMKRLHMLLRLTFENENYYHGPDAQLCPTAHILDEQRFPWLWFIFIGREIIFTENGAVKKCVKQTTWTMLWQDIVPCHFLSLGCFPFAGMHYVR